MTQVRTAYTCHFLRAHAQGFQPLSLRAFVALAAHAAFKG